MPRVTYKDPLNIFYGDPPGTPTGLGNLLRVYSDPIWKDQKFPNQRIYTFGKRLISINGATDDLLARYEDLGHFHMTCAYLTLQSGSQEKKQHMLKSSIVSTDEVHPREPTVDPIEVRASFVKGTKAIQDGLPKGSKWVGWIEPIPRAFADYRLLEGPPASDMTAHRNDVVTSIDEVEKITHPEAKATAPNRIVQSHQLSGVTTKQAEASEPCISDIEEACWSTRLKFCKLTAMLILQSLIRCSHPEYPYIPTFRLRYIHTCPQRPRDGGRESVVAKSSSRCLDRHLDFLVHYRCKLRQ